MGAYRLLSGFDGVLTMMNGEEEERVRWTEERREWGRTRPAEEPRLGLSSLVQRVDVKVSC